MELSQDPSATSERMFSRDTSIFAWAVDEAVPHGLAPP